MGNRRLTTAGLVAAAVGVGLTTGCPTVDLGDTPSDIGLCNPPGGIEYFEQQIWPSYIVRSGDTSCTKAGGCHNETGGNALGFRTMPVDLPFNYRQAQIYLNCGTSDASPLLTKPLAGIDPHGGMDIFSSSDPAVQIFLDWFM
ncbi:MAG: hypothetical protein AB7P03_24675 [Kofleriaceae bacterium]